MSRKHGPTLRRLSVEALEVRLCLSTLPVAATSAPPDIATQSRLSAAYGQLPLSFEANKGQTDAHVNFLSRGAGYSLFLTPSKAVLSLEQGDASNVVGMKVVGANPASHAVGLDKQPGVSNYLIGNDPTQWHTGISNYGEVAYRGVYRGIDLVYHGDQRQLEYDFVVKPGSNPRGIRLAFDGIQGKALDAHGNLVLHTSGGDVVEHAPVAYQTIHGVRHPVAARFVLDRGGRVGFQLGRYDHGQPLVIDPVLSYSTYLGGSGNDSGYAIAVDGAGNAYVTGNTTSSADFPLKNPAQAVHGGGGHDAFVTKLNAAGTAILYSTFLGGSGQEWGGSGIALYTDPSGNTFAAVTGDTNSTNFPTKNAAQATLGGDFDAFVAELNPVGGLAYSTYLGGSGTEDPYSADFHFGISMDASGNAYVGGATRSTNFPTTQGAFQTTPGGGLANPYDAFVTKLNSAGAIVYSTYAGSTGNDFASGIAVDASGDAFVTGFTDSDFPTTAGAFQTAALVGTSTVNTFVTKLNPAGSALLYSTYLGGGGEDRGLGIAVGSSGTAYVTGWTTSGDFPTLNAFQPVKGSGKDAFATALNATGSALVYSTFLGGSGDPANSASSGNDYGSGIAVDSVGNAYLTGETRSSDFPVLTAFQPVRGGSGDAFVTKLSPTGNGLYSSFLGGSDWDSGQGIAVDGTGNAYLTGFTYSTNFPTKAPFQSKINGKGRSGPVDAFVTKISAI